MTTANIITISRICLVPVFIYFLYNMGNSTLYNILAIVIFLILSLTDFLDGYIARKYNQVTNFGKFLDPLADKILITSAMIVLIGLGKMNSVFALIVIAREFLITSLRLIASDNSSVVISASIWGKVKTFSQIVFIVAAMSEKYLTAVYNFPYATFFAWVMLILTIYSGIDYLVKNAKFLRN